MKYLLLILDGWGYREEKEGNAIINGRTPVYDEMMRALPHTLLATCGERVGLPEGVMGNSEVGHMNIGAGRVVYQEITFINKAIREGAFFHNPVLLEAMKKGAASRLHLLGLLSDGGVHSHEEHLYALLEMARQQGVPDVFIHALMDGRDTPPHAGKNYMARLQGKIREIGVGRVATVCGRYYAMDRDTRWERTAQAYDAFVHGQGIKETDPVAALEHSYDEGVTDEFVKPVVITEDGAPVATMRSGDVLIFFNFRSDRARQITHALNDENFDGFARTRKPELHYVTFTQYDATFDYPICFPPRKLINILAEVFAAGGVRNLRMAETEKYAHVTFFFNGGVEEPFAGERRILIPSPKVATYDLQPEMSAVPLTDRFLQELERNVDDVYIVNFANGDMVGHTGVYEAAIRAVETVDRCVGRIYQKVKEMGACLIVTADHGNSEMEFDPVNGGPHTAHTLNDVPFIIYHPSRSIQLKSGGALENIAPTLLDLMGLAKPAEMTGSSLLV
ncbi:MAG: 2,3-bisphosphoglycerate-independent phosphoglycerate mutase [Acidobacteria bacterium]|nr:2,3-bisphosphoglycerate-independent phosphoglycerate mutase [Acidobacteriota bacterium]